jgi:hypothetical protein
MFPFLSQRASCLTRWKERYLVALAFTLLLLVPLAEAQAQPQSKRLPVTVQDVDAGLGSSWFGIYSQGEKIGYASSAREKLTDRGRTIYRERSSVHLNLNQLGQKTTIAKEQTLDFDSTPPFRLLRVEYDHHTGKVLERIRLTAKEGGEGVEYEATITRGKVTENKTVKHLDFTLADLVSSEVWLKSGPKAGETLTTADLSLEDLATIPVSAKLLGTKEIVQDGIVSKVHDVESYNHKSKLTTVGRFTDDAQLLKLVIAGKIEVRRESESEAKKIVFGADMIMGAAAKVDQPLGDARRVRGLILEGKGKEVGILSDGPLQTVVSLGDDRYTVKIGPRHAKKVKATDVERKEALAATKAYPIGDPKVLALARQAIGDAQTDQEKVKRLCKFVHEFIKPEIVNDPNIHDLLDHKSGDCKSYALLMTCLSRAAGLPARQVLGYAYMTLFGAPDSQSFGGHAWTEVVVEGYWLPVDAVLNSTELGASHIRVQTVATLQDATSFQDTNGKLSFKVIEIERAN